MSLCSIGKVHVDSHRTLKEQKLACDFKLFNPPFIINRINKRHEYLSIKASFFEVSVAI